MAPIAAPPGAFGDAPTDYLLTDTLEAAPGAGDLAWAVPGRFLACFRATLDGCWRRDAVGSAGHDCKRHFTAFAAAVGDGQPASGFRRSWPCYLAPGRPRPPWASGSFEAADGPSMLAEWQRANGYRYDPANPTAVLSWDFVCPAPRVLRRVTSASRRDSLVAEPGRELCDHLREHHAPGLGDLPTAVDWRTKSPSVVTPPKNQGGCGSCWAFSATETLESAVAIATGKLLTLSPQQIVSCTPNPDDCGGTGGCSGATQQLGFNYTMGAGITTETNYPYRGTTGTCEPSKVKVRVCDTCV